MAPMCRVLCSLLLAVTVARAGVTITWNTHNRAAHTAQNAVQSARVLAVQGSRVLLQLRDGSVRNYVATPAQARVLHALIGTIIQFQAR